ncbi:MAG: TonB-dependent siderophore receptor [Pseudomonadota bacterium]
MKFLTYYLASAAAVAAVVPASFAQSDSGEQLEEVEVFGRYLYVDQVNAVKTPTPIIDVPQSLSIFTAEQIALQGLSSIGEVVNYTPGVNTSQGEGHRDAVVFRGVRSTADFFIDGVRDDVQYYRPLYNLEQVEILRGPNALLFGRGGTGGVLNRVTKKSVIDETFTNYQLTFDSFGEFGGQLDTNYSISNKSALRVNFMYESLDNHRDFFDGTQIGFNPTARFQISPDTTVDVSYEYVDHERFIDRGIPTGADGEPVEAFDEIVFGDAALNETTLEAHLFRATVEHAFTANMKGRASLFHGDYDKLYQNFYASAFDPDTNIVGIDGYIDTTERQNTILSADLIGELVTGRIGHTLVAGFEFIDTSNDNDRFNPVWSGSNDDVEFFNVMRPLMFENGMGVNASGDTTAMTFSDLNDDTAADVEVFSFYLQDEIEFSEQLDVVLGLRFDSFDIDVDNLDPDNLESRNRKDDEVSPRFGVVYKPVENVSIYGSYSESFLPRSGEQFANINGDNNRLDPNTFSNMEVGIKWDFVNSLSLTAAIFEIEQESPVVSDADASQFDIIRTTVDGFEAQLQGRLTDTWTISAGYSYLDGKQANGTLRPRELPENMFSVWNTYQPTEKIGVGFGLTYQDESFINNSNSATLPAYTRADAMVFYNLSDTMRIQLNVENLTDEEYFPNSHSTHQATVGAPLNARLTFVSRQF